MKNTKLEIKALQYIIDKFGVAQTAVWLGYSDTQTVKQWVARKKIPFNRMDLVSNMLKERPWRAGSYAVYFQQERSK